MKGDIFLLNLKKENLSASQNQLVLLAFFVCITLDLVVSLIECLQHKFNAKMTLSKLQSCKVNYRLLTKHTQPFRKFSD